MLFSLLFIYFYKLAAYVIPDIGMIGVCEHFTYNSTMTMLTKPYNK